MPKARQSPANSKKEFAELFIKTAMETTLDAVVSIVVLLHFGCMRYFFFENKMQIRREMTNFASHSDSGHS